jgi:hypothetical protein
VAAYEVAREHKTGFVDAATAFHKAGSREEALRRKYWAWDNLHLGPVARAWAFPRIPTLWRA